MKEVTMSSMAQSIRDSDSEEHENLLGVDPEESDAYYVDDDGDVHVKPMTLGNSPGAYEWFEDERLAPDRSLGEKVLRVLKTLYHGHPPGVTGDTGFPPYQAAVLIQIVVLAEMSL